MTTGDPDAERFDVLIVGAGFAGLHLLHQARAAGLRAKVLEKAGGVGGTWFWNRYPGARCDIESFDYQFSFAPELVAEWRWSERYAAQPEILRYLEFAATRLDLYRDIDFGVTVRSATFDETTAIWTLATSTGERLLANYCVMAVGNLSAIKRPDVAGLEDFGGQWFHTGNWPTQPVDLTDKRVAVIGTGSSGSQTITAIAPVVAQLYVLQRTPNYSMPAQNRPITDAENAEVLADWELRRHTCEWSDAGTPLPPATRRAIDVTDADRAQAYAEGWQRGGISALSGAFTDMFTDERSNQFAQNFAREQIRATVADPAVADLLCPSHHIGTKRTCVDTGYFQTFNRPNVELVDVRQAPIVEVNESGIRTADRQIDVDVIIFAIGFDAITGALDQIDIRGRNDQSLTSKWADGPTTLLGLMTAGFPNLFFVTGPGSPSVLSNMVISIEQHVDWIIDCIDHLRANDRACIEPEGAAELEWMAHIDDLVRPTLYLQAQSWYVGANMEAKPRAFTIYTAGCGPYRQACDEIVAAGYRGFRLSNPNDDAQNGATDE